MTVALLNVTRDEVAVRQLAKAADRMRRLETEMTAAFDEFWNAKEAMAEVGLVVDIQLKPGTSAAFSAWKQDQAKARGRADARRLEETHDQAD